MELKLNPLSFCILGFYGFSKEEELDMEEIAVSNGLLIFMKPVISCFACILHGYLTVFFVKRRSSVVVQLERLRNYLSRRLSSKNCCRIYIYVIFGDLYYMQLIIVAVFLSYIFLLLIYVFC